MTIFLSIKDSERGKFFEKLKSQIGYSWEKFYPKYDISRATFFNYLSGRKDIPKKLFLEWQKLIGNFPISFKEEERQEYLPKSIPKISMDKKLSEIIGILNGDGHLSKVNYEVCVVGDLKEKNYFTYMKKLFEDKLGILFTLREEKAYYKLRCYCKELSEFLSRTYKLPKGNKLGKLKIPKAIKQNGTLLKSYIRGLYDTDGSFYIRRKKDPVVQITSADNSFLKEVRNALVILGFTVSKGDQRVFIYDKKDVEKFFEEIKPANNKHLKKYQKYLKSGRE